MSVFLVKGVIATVRLPPHAYPRKDSPLLLFDHNKPYERVIVCDDCLLIDTV